MKCRIKYFIYIYVYIYAYSKYYITPQCEFKEGQI